MEIIYLVIESKSEDYHGVDHEVKGAYKNQDDAQTESNRLNSESDEYDTSYDIEGFELL